MNSLMVGNRGGFGLQGGGDGRTNANSRLEKFQFPEFTFGFTCCSYFVELFASQFPFRESWLGLS